MPKYIVTGSVNIVRNFRHEVEAENKDAAIKEVSAIFSNACSITLQPKDDVIHLIEILSTKRNRKRLMPKCCWENFLDKCTAEISVGETANQIDDSNQ